MYLSLNEKEKALMYFEKAYATNDFWLIFMDRMPCIDCMRDEPGYQAIRNRLFEKVQV